MANPPSILEYMPVGFRFRPTDEELVGHYMKHKLNGDHFLSQIIPEIDLCKHEPWDLPDFSVMKSDDPEWFFFSPPDFKYSNSNRANRATECGFWKATGKDRKIKVRGTDNVIGMKKTLVFYRGRVPNGVKTNWVIHEYHAVTFPVRQRTFALCRLMKKPEKKTEERTAEGEPSSRMASDSESQPSSGRIPDVCPLPASETLEAIFPMPPQANERDLPSPFAAIDHDLPSQAYFLPNFGNENIGGAPFETTEEEEEFVSSLFVNDDVFSREETRHDAFVVNDSTPSESLKMVYYESSDTDAEVVSVRIFESERNVSMNCFWERGFYKVGDTDILRVSNKNAGSSEYGLRRTMVVKSSSSHAGAKHIGTSELSSNQEASIEKRSISISFQDDFPGVDTSSGDSTPVKPRIEISSSPSTLKASRVQYQPRSANSVSQRTGARRSQTPRKVSTKAASRHHEAQKDMLKDTVSRNSSESPSNRSFIHMETPALSQNLSPPSLNLIDLIEQLAKTGCIYSTYVASSNKMDSDPLNCISRIVYCVEDTDLKCKKEAIIKS
ncbi:NAC domain-containing protein 69 [Senna tora]|uniref:NAC domain-containing protein 69 n=1 Tax=Senna tora TaxID=362788 RepID=A0A834XI84_9FABA|nr:NAC domain-containing protein 69 [Senna tora]